MKNFLNLIVILVSLYSCAQKSQVAITLDKIIDHAESSSLYRNKVDWKTLKTKMYELSRDADSIQKLKPAIELMLKELNDEHGRVFYDNQMLAYYYGQPKEHQKHFDPKIYGIIQQGKEYKFTAKMISEDIGYIRIVGLPMGDNKKMAKEIQDKLCELENAGAKNWIVDLRYNGGGNMHPMAEGLTAIIRNGKVGGSKGQTIEENSAWKVANGDFYYNDYSVQLENDCMVDKNAKVAVLTSVYTASSGEAIAVIFKGRENTRFFGEKTLGMVTVTDWTKIDSLTTMSISVSYYNDRNGNVYDEYVDVDEEIGFDPKQEIDNDTGINQAINWIKNN